MERDENGVYSLLYRKDTESCFNADGGNGAVGGVTDPGTEGNGGCRCEGCGQRQLAMVYSPMQCWRRLHTPEDALTKGTLFEELYKPYEEVW